MPKSGTVEHTIITKNKIEFICQLKKRPLKINLREGSRTIIIENASPWNLAENRRDDAFGSLESLYQFLAKSTSSFWPFSRVKDGQKVNLWKKSTLTYNVVSRFKRCVLSCWSFFIKWPTTCDLPFDLCLYPELGTEVTLLQGIGTGQTGGHRWLVILWKMISMTIRIFWAYSRPSTSKLIFFKDWTFDHLWSLKKVRRNSTIFLKICIHVLGTQRRHPCEFHQNRTAGHFLL